MPSRVAGRREGERIFFFLAETFWDGLLLPMLLSSKPGLQPEDVLLLTALFWAHLVPLRPCQAFPQAKDPKQDACGRQSRSLRHRRPGVSDC